MVDILLHALHRLKLNQSFEIVRVKGCSKHVSSVVVTCVAGAALVSPPLPQWPSLDFALTLTTLINMY